MQSVRSLLLALALALAPGRVSLAQEAAPSAAAVPAAAPGPLEAQEDGDFEGALRDARDGEDFAETRGYRRLLELVTRYREEELVSKVEANLDLAAAQTDPAAWRGRIVRVRGVIIGLTTERLQTRIGANQDAYRAVVWDGERAAIVDFLQPPPEVRLERDVVDIEGVFLRTVRYASENGKNPLAPFVIGRGLRVVDEDSLHSSTKLDTFASILCGAVGLFLVVRIALTLRKSSKRAPRHSPDSVLRERSALPRRPPRSPRSATKS